MEAQPSTQEAAGFFQTNRSTEQNSKQLSLNMNNSKSPASFYHEFGFCFFFFFFLKKTFLGLTELTVSRQDRSRKALFPSLPGDLAGVAAPVTGDIPLSGGGTGDPLWPGVYKS